MAAYLIISNEITDEALYDQFRQRIAPVIEAHGGKFLAGGAFEVLEGDWVPDRVVVLEFDDVDAVKAYRASAEYQDLRVTLDQASTAHIIVAEGV